MWGGVFVVYHRLSEQLPALIAVKKPQAVLLNLGGVGTLSGFLYAISVADNEATLFANL